MPQELISQFDRKIAMPIETFRQVQTINLRDAIPTNIRWEGMIVYVVSESLSYVLVGGLSNSQWVDLGTLVNVTVRDNLTSTSTTDALSANQGRILRGLIDNIPVGVDWGNIGGTLSDQTDLQSALNSKENTITGGATTITSSNLTANRALISNGSGKVAVSAVTNTEIGYLDGVTSAIQAQINGKYTTPSGTTSQYVRGDGSLATFPAIPTVPVSSVFGRTGAITAQSNDYTFAQIGSKPTTIAGYGITDFNSLGDARWVPLTRTLTGGDGIDTIGDLSANRTIAVNSTVVRTSGNQSIAGTKTFTGNQIELTGTNPRIRYIGSNGGDWITLVNNGDFDIRENNTSNVRLRISPGGSTEVFGSVTAAAFKTTNWEIVESGGVLQFKQGGTVRFQMKSTGVIEATNFKLGLT